MKVHEFSRLEAKLRLKTRNSSHRLAWFEYEGKVVTRTKRSHGNKDLPASLIRQQLKLNEEELSGVISCALEFDDYVEILRNKGLIPRART
ncbi:MAG: hypothetical protein AAB225_00905 [Acidobacteriota bacterium]